MQALMDGRMECEQFSYLFCQSIECIDNDEAPKASINSINGPHREKSYKRIRKRRNRKTKNERKKRNDDDIEIAMLIVEFIMCNISIQKYAFFGICGVKGLTIVPVKARAHLRNHLRNNLLVDILTVMFTNLSP